MLDKCNSVHIKLRIHTNISHCGIQWVAFMVGVVHITVLIMFCVDKSKNVFFSFQIVSSSFAIQMLSSKYIDNVNIAADYNDHNLKGIFHILDISEQMNVYYRLHSMH